MATTTISTGFVQPHSIHPKIQVDISGHQAKGCDLHLFVWTNDKIFFDPYEIEDIWQPSGVSLGNPIEVISWDLSPSVPDLERPVKYGFEGSKEMHNETVVENQLHVQLAWPSAGPLQHSITAHARYQQPDTSGYRQVRISAADSTASAFAFDVDVRALWSCQAASNSMGESGFCIPTVRKCHNPILLFPRFTIKPSGSKPRHHETSIRCPSVQHRLRCISKWQHHRIHHPPTRRCTITSNFRRGHHALRRDRMFPLDHKGAGRSRTTAFQISRRPSIEGGLDGDHVGQGIEFGIRLGGVRDDVAQGVVVVVASAT